MGPQKQDDRTVIGIIVTFYSTLVRMRLTRYIKVVDAYLYSGQ